MTLRDETGLPMMDCKKALQEANGDVELAKQQVRESGKKIMAIRAGPHDRGRPDRRLFQPEAAVGAMIELRRVGTGRQARGLRGIGQRPGQAAGHRSRRKDARGALEAAGAEPQRRRRCSSGKTRSRARSARSSGSTRIVRIDGPSGGYAHHDAQERRAAGSRRRQRRAGQGHCHARHGHEAKVDEQGRSRPGGGRKRNAKSSPNRPARKASRRTSSTRWSKAGCGTSTPSTCCRAAVREGRQNRRSARSPNAGGMKLEKFTRWELGETDAAAGEINPKPSMPWETSQGFFMIQHARADPTFPANPLPCPLLTARTTGSC